jgi:hypothetical protein
LTTFKSQNRFSHQCAHGNKRSDISDILTDGYPIRRQAVEFHIPVITNLQLAAALVDVLKQKGKKR